MEGRPPHSHWQVQHVVPVPEQFTASCVLLVLDKHQHAVRPGGGARHVWGRVDRQVKIKGVRVSLAPRLCQPQLQAIPKTPCQRSLREVLLPVLRGAWETQGAFESHFHVRPEEVESIVGGHWHGAAA